MQNTDDTFDAHLHRSAIIWTVLTKELARLHADGFTTVSIVDVGGGSGTIAVPLAALGHTVTVVDPSAVALASLHQRANESNVASSIATRQGDMDELDTLVAANSADIVLCHNVLESVEEPEEALLSLHRICREGGAVSLVVPNRVAAVVSRAMVGQFGSAIDVLMDRFGTGKGDSVRHRFETATFTALVGSTGLQTEQVHGVDIFDGFVPETGDDAEALVALERKVAARVPFRDMAAQLHILARKPFPLK